MTRRRSRALGRSAAYGPPWDMSFRILGDVLRGEGRGRLELPDVRGGRMRRRRNERGQQACQHGQHGRRLSHES